MMHYIFPLLLFSSLLAAAPTVIESDAANYNGKDMSLAGNVTLKHPFGTIQADKADLSEPGKEMDFRFLHLENNVRLSLKEESTIKCTRLDLDAKTGQAELFGDHAPILLEGKLHSRPLILQSPYIELSFDPTEKQLKTMKAHAQIVATYAEHFTLNADTALYNQSKNCLSFFPPCTLTSPNTIHVEGTQIDLLLDKQEILFHDPKGTLNDLHFSGNTLTWLEEKGKLCLHSNISMTYGTASLANNHEVCLILDKNREVERIESQGLTKMTCDGDISLTCPGKTIVLLGPKQIRLSDHVVYKDPSGVLKADTMILDYILVNGKMVPSKLTFKGNVEAFNDAPLQKGEVGPIERYAVADLVTYLPSKKEITLTALPNKRVLFCDRVKNIQLSADEIIADTGGTEHIRTKGHVRMVFSEKEAHLLKEKFGHE